MAPLPRQTASYSLASLKRWSCRNNDLPSVASIKHIHVYDFDNTLFSSPLPNPQLWAGPTIGYLQTRDCFSGGGWWHDPGILSATGEGLEKEQANAWKGWWNEAVVHLVELSIKQKDAITVLLTGRGEINFADLVKRILDSRELKFDLICLKPEVGPSGQRFKSTIDFKNEFLKHLVFTYNNADELRIYEDRPKHVKHFRDHFEKLNKSLLSHPVHQPPPPRKPITADVVQVTELNSSLDPVTETSIVQFIINKHNTAVTKGLPNLTHSPYGRMKISSSYIYFGYLINAKDSARLITLANIQPPSLMDSSDVRLMANSILIAPRPPNRQTLDRVGGKGKKVKWQVTGTAVFENKIWAVRVSPVPETEKYHTNDPVPVVVLAVRRGARPIDAARIQHWHPVPAERAYIFETVVGDKQTLRIEAEDSGDERHGPRPQHRNFANRNQYAAGGGGGQDHTRKRKFGREHNAYAGARDNHDDFPALPRADDRDMVMRDREDGVWMPQDRARGYPNHIGTSGGGRYGERERDPVGGQFGSSTNNHDGRRHFSNSGRGGSGTGGYQALRGGGGSGRGGGGAVFNNPSDSNSRTFNRRYEHGHGGNYINNGIAQQGGSGGGPKIGAPAPRNRGSDRRDRGGGGGIGGMGGRGGRGGGAGTGASDGTVIMNY